MPAGGRGDGAALELVPFVGSIRAGRHGDGARSVHSGDQTQRGDGHEDPWRHRLPHRTNGSTTAAILEKGTPSRATPDGTVTSRRSSIAATKPTVRLVPPRKDTHVPHATP